MVRGVEDSSLVGRDNETYDLDVWFIDALLKEMVRKKVVSGSRDDVLRIVELLALSEEGPERLGTTARRKLTRLGTNL